MASKPITVRLSAVELDALAKYPGRTPAQKIRAAIMSGSLISALRAATREELRETEALIISELRDTERALLSALESRPPAPEMPPSAPPGRQSADPILAPALAQLRKKGIIK